MKTVSTTIHETETYTLTIKPTFTDRLKESSTYNVFDPKDPTKEERAFEARITKLSKNTQLKR